MYITKGLRSKGFYAASVVCSKCFSDSSITAVRKLIIYRGETVWLVFTETCCPVTLFSCKITKDLLVNAVSQVDGLNFNTQLLTQSLAVSYQQVFKYGICMVWSCPPEQLLLIISNCWTENCGQLCKHCLSNVTLTPDQ